MPDDVDELVGLMPDAESSPEAGAASRAADLTAIIGISDEGDAFGWQALRETLDRFGAQAESYRMKMLGDRYLVEVWFVSAGTEADVHWQKTLNKLEGNADQ